MGQFEVKNYLLRSLIVLVCIPGALLADDASQKKEPRIGNIAAAKILILGNSITLHGPAPEIGWSGNWGMAASSEDKDFAHLLVKQIAQVTGKEPLLLAKNIASFERGYWEYDFLKELKTELEFRADIVILAIGENVAEPTTEESKKAFASGCEKLIQTVRAHGEPTIFVRSSFWANTVKDEILKSACKATKATYVDISNLGAIESNAARSERKIEHAGVGAHPGDAGMQAIADAIFKSIEEQSKLVVDKK